MFVWEDNDMPYSRIKINATNISIWEKLKKRNKNFEKKKKAADTNSITEKMLKYGCGLFMDWLCNLLKHVKSAFVSDKAVIVPGYKRKVSKNE